MDINTEIQECPICKQKDKGWLCTDVTWSDQVGFNNGPENYAMFRTKICKGCGFSVTFAEAQYRQDVRDKRHLQPVALGGK